MQEGDQPGQLCDHAEPCGCYAEGYAAGKAKAFAEVRSVVVADNHPDSCGCEPCKLIRDILASRLPSQTTMDDWSVRIDD